MSEFYNPAALTYPVRIRCVTAGFVFCGNYRVKRNDEFIAHGVERLENGKWAFQVKRYNLIGLMPAEHFMVLDPADHEEEDQTVQIEAVAQKYASNALFGRF